MRTTFLGTFVLAIAMEVIIVCAPAPCQVTKDTLGWFEFVIPGLDATETPVSMSFLNPEPAGTAGFVEVEGSHFVDGSGRRLKFLGTNLTFSGAFPDKEVAPRIAAHMRKLGINIVRFHHMDNSPAPRGIWLDDRKTFDPVQIDKLDWMIYQLKQNGIYTNLNLHVSRNYPGLPPDIRTFLFGKCLDHFYQPYIEMQKEYARELLMHRNPYTGTLYAHEPAVAFVEINNENTLIRDWSDLLRMPDPFKSALLEQWHHWLRQTYRDTDELRADWDVAREPIGDEVLRNTDLSEGDQYWALETGTSARAKLEVSEDDSGLSKKTLHVITLKPGEQSWNLQLHQLGLTLEDGVPYTLSFRAKSDDARDVNVGVRLQKPPWSFLGLQKTVKLTTEWREFRFVFQAQDTEPELTRLSFNLRNQIGHFWFADLSLKRGGTIGLADDQSLEAGNIALPQTDAPSGVRQSFWQFLIDTEMKYSEEMVRFLTDELSIRPSVSVTQASYGGIAGVYRESEFSDYVDMHSYWQHPRFPATPWSRKVWNIPNTSMVQDPNGGTLTRLAIHRVSGKPFTVSEYDHPAPNDHTAEMFPMLASFAAFQDWDGLYQFDYNGRDWDQQRISGYFSMNGHPGKLAFLPVAAVMFRMNGVSADTEPTVLQFPTDEIVPQLTQHGTNTRAAWEAAGASAVLPLTNAVAVQFRDGALSLSRTAKEPSGKWISHTGEIVWNKGDPRTAIYTINSHVVRAAVGYLGGQTVTLGDVSIKMPQTETNWASIAIAALDGKSISKSDRILLVAVGRVENTNMGWNHDRTSVSDQWGNEPTVAEGVPATITFSKSDDRIVRSLDGTGMPKGNVPCHSSDAGTAFDIGAEHGTLWYLITRP